MLHWQEAHINKAIAYKCGGRVWFWFWLSCGGRGKAGGSRFIAVERLSGIAVAHGLISLSYLCSSMLAPTQDGSTDNSWKPTEKSNPEYTWHCRVVTMCTTGKNTVLKCEQFLQINNSGQHKVESVCQQTEHQVIKIISSSSI